MDSINGISYYLSKCQTLLNTSQMTFFLSGRQRIGTCIVRATQFNYCGAVNLLSPEPCPQQPRAERIDYKI